MRSIAYITPTFWTRGSGKKLRGNSDAIALAFYLMTATFIGASFSSGTSIRCASRFCLLSTLIGEVGRAVGPTEVSLVYEIWQQVSSSVVVSSPWFRPEGRFPGLRAAARPRCGAGR